MTRHAFRHQKPRHPDNGGFTLVEIIVTIILLGIIGSFSGHMLVNAVRSYTFAHDNAELTQKAQVAMMRITTELSRVKNFNCDPATNQINYTLCDDEVVVIQHSGANILYEKDGVNILVDQVIDFEVKYDSVSRMCRVKLTIKGLNDVEKGFSTEVKPISGNCPI